MVSYIVCFTIIAFLSYLSYIYILFTSDRATTHIDRYWEHYEYILEKIGLRMKHEPSNIDSTPCGITFHITGKVKNVEVNIRRLSSRKTLKLLNLIKADKISNINWEKLSSWDFSKIPE